MIECLIVLIRTFGGLSLPEGVGVIQWLGLLCLCLLCGILLLLQ